MAQNQKTMFLYAGQGSQFPGMGKDLYEVNVTFRNVIDQSQACLSTRAKELELPEGFDLRVLLFTGHATAVWKGIPEEEGKLTAKDECASVQDTVAEASGGDIHETSYTQPAMVAFACAMTEVLKEKGYRPEMAAGLSLGEYSALYAAGVFELSDVVALARFRGVQMMKASHGIKSGMSAVLGLDSKSLEEICDAVTKEAAGNPESVKKVVSVCNLNCPGQIVIGGAAELVEEAARRAQEAGARRCIPLHVSGPFHTAYMQPAGEALAQYFPELPFHPAEFPVLFNCTGKECAPEQMTKETISELLVRQVQSPVRMEDILRRSFQLGINHFVEIGPGKTLSGFVKKVAKELGIESDAYSIVSFEKAEDLV